MSVKPDTIRLMLTLEDTRETYADTLEQSTMQVESLKGCFEKLGFARTDLKTLNFNVDTEHESYQDINRNLMLEEDCCMSDETYDIDIEADDIDLTDTVTVVWQIG